MISLCSTVKRRLARLREWLARFGKSALNALGYRTFPEPPAMSAGGLDRLMLVETGPGMTVITERLEFPVYNEAIMATGIVTKYLVWSPERESYVLVSIKVDGTTLVRTVGLSSVLGRFSGVPIVTAEA